MTVYTKRGDKGLTTACRGKQMSKSSKLISAIGAIDELNSFLGIVGGLVEIQKKLFTINAIIAGAKMDFSSDSITELEKKIDEIEKSIPVQKKFIVYGGTKKSSELFYARSICRRAERELTALKVINSKFKITSYINRLSDYLFVLARKENVRNKVKEENWE